MIEKLLTDLSFTRLSVERSFGRLIEINKKYSYQIDLNTKTLLRYIQNDIKTMNDLVYNPKYQMINVIK